MVEPLLDASVKQAIRDVVNGVVASMPSTVTVRHKTSHDRYGETYGPPETYIAMVQYKQTVVTNGAGEQVVSTGLLVFPFPAPVIDPEDQIELEGGAKPPIKAVTRDGSADPVAPTEVFF